MSREFGAPYNDISFEGYIDVRIYVSGTIQGPVNKSEVEELCQDELKDLSNEMFRHIHRQDNVWDVDILDQKLT